MKFFKKLPVSIRFSSTIFENSLASGGGAPPPEPPTNAYVHIFLNYWHNFRENSIKFFKNFEKMANFPLELSKKFSFPLIFLLRFPEIR